MNGNSSNNTSQNTPLPFDALLGGRTGLTPYGASVGDANPFDSNYALSLQSGFAGQYPVLDGGTYSTSNNYTGVDFGNPSPPSDDSMSGLNSEQQRRLSALGSLGTGTLPDNEMPMSQAQMLELQRFANASQQFNQVRARPHMADRPTFDPTADPAFAMVGIKIGDTVSVQPDKPFSHLDMLRRDSSEQSNDSSASVSPRPAVSSSRRINTKIAARRGGGVSTIDAKRAAKADAGNLSSPKTRRRSTAASIETSTGTAAEDGDEDESKRAEFLERNRIAASKCRHKKKEWTNNLEAAARQASQQSRELQAIVAELQSELIHYQNELLAHQHCDNCHIQTYLGHMAGPRSPRNHGGHQFYPSQ